ncbi:MAG: prkC 12 [Planctomycetota bacterium]|nr:prkC 12 [Planctomycetota bacterium]
MNASRPPPPLPPPLPGGELEFPAPPRLTRSWITAIVSMCALLGWLSWRRVEQIVSPPRMNAPDPVVSRSDPIQANSRISPPDPVVAERLTNHQSERHEAPPRASIEPASPPVREERGAYNSDRDEPVDSPRGPVENLEALTLMPEKYEGRTIVAARFFYIGTRVKRKDGVAILPIQTFHHATLSDGESIGAEGMLYLIDPAVADTFDEWLSKNNFEKSIRPTSKARLKFEVRRVRIGDEPRWGAVVVEIEVLLGLNYDKIATANYDGSIAVGRIAGVDAELTLGDGPDWVERLGGADYSTNVRRKIREARRSARVKDDQAALNAVISRLIGESFLRARADEAAELERQRRIWRMLAR